jgi:hypothetical protein
MQGGIPGGWSYVNGHCSVIISTILTKSRGARKARNDPRGRCAAGASVRSPSATIAVLFGRSDGRAPDTTGALPGLRGAAVRAGDRRRDGRAEDEAAVAGVGGLVDRPACVAHTLCGWIDGMSARGGRGADERRRRCARCLDHAGGGSAAVSAGACATAFAQGVGEACSHGSMRKDPSHEQRFRPATAISWGPRPLGCAPGGAHRCHGDKIGLEY